MASIILAADTATTTEAVAVLRGETVLAERSAARGRGRGQALLELVHGALGDADTTIGQVDALVCGLGPGSFTGLRVVMATFKGLALALDRPLYGVPTAHAFAVAHPGRVVYAITDARRGEVFVDSAALEAPVSCKPADLARWVPEREASPLLLGNGAWAHRAALRAAQAPDATGVWRRWRPPRCHTRYLKFLSNTEMIQKNAFARHRARL